MNLKNKVVVVTGSSSGLGQAIAIRFAQEGAKVFINYHINKVGGEETASEVKKNGGISLLVQADVTKLTDIKRLFSTVIKEFGAVDILINNAAIGTDKVPFMEAAYDDFLEMVNADLIGPMMCSQHAVKIMEKQGYGKILNTSSIRGIEYGGRAEVYAACKAGINNFTKTLAKHVAPHIHVNAVAPGCVRTRTYDSMPQELIDKLIDQAYLKRWVTKDEVADAFIFLAKNDAMTGQVLYVDAGFTLK